jgi:hypothetical protein
LSTLIGALKAGKALYSPVQRLYRIVTDGVEPKEKTKDELKAIETYITPP